MKKFSSIGCKNRRRNFSEEPDPVDDLAASLKRTFFEVLRFDAKRASVAATQAGQDRTLQLHIRPP
jgi:hypothetical protein